MTHRDHLTCRSCELRHLQVEAGGLWFCPNVACSGPGAYAFRSTLESFTDHGTTHSVDHLEWAAKAILHARTLDDRILREHINESATKLLQEKTAS